MDGVGSQLGRRRRSLGGGKFGLQGAVGRNKKKQLAIGEEEKKKKKMIFYFIFINRVLLIFQGSFETFIKMC